MSETTTSTVTANKRSRYSFATFLEQYALVILMFLVIAFFTFNPASSVAFPTLQNFNVILGNQAIVALIAIAALFPLIAGYFDFSLGAIATLSQCLTAGLMAFSGLPMWLAITISMLVSLLIGVLNGLMVTKWKLDPFVTTLGMSILLTGIIQWYTGGQTIVAGIDPAVADFGSSKILGLPTVIFVVLLVAIVAWYFFSHTPNGRSLYAIGSNASSARLVGIRVDKSVWWTFIVAAGISGLAGVVYLARMGSATAGSGGDLLFSGLAAVFLGATAIRPGFFNVWGTIIGAIFVSVTVSGLVLSGASGWASPVFNGLVLILAVGISTYLGRRRAAGK